MAVNSQHLVLITGGSGFIGGYCILVALRDGYRVRTTVRSLDRADSVREMLCYGGVEKDSLGSIEFVAADLKDDSNWPEACAGCTYVLHVASPFPDAAPKHEQDLVVPAREGTLRVLRAAKEAKSVKRVVVTSSCAAISHGHPPERHEKTFTEEDWTDVDNPKSPVTAYQKSKTVAERLEVATVNPCGVYGPLSSTSVSASMKTIEFMMKSFPLIPQLGYGVVDVRDVADLHILAMTNPQASGERFIACADQYAELRDIAKILKQRFGNKAKKVLTRDAPNWLLKLAAYFDPQVALVASDLGKRYQESNAKAKRVLGWRPRSAEESIVDTTESMERFNLLT
ncbi:NAD-dependent epimerase/dehydratase [Lophiostoma macrostomum CBS 122681]|uniref:NAD-dependent epimerase/dehydratase n=1 Tax=Lophiostoma macrostomum CBS 122681 TaxID=1314788 RepID=A0A6A6SXR7_9PLEO|nr:NAD-dependent epimerase/dehydratase [Lophiostoma macrostomum CBS 122681]